MKDPDPVSCHDAQNPRYTLNYEEPLPPYGVVYLTPKK